MKVVEHHGCSKTVTEVSMPLFERPLSHRNDPITSYEAADKMVKSGKLNRQEDNVWTWIIKMSKHYADFTAREIDNYCGLGYYLIQRRLSGLKDKGKITRTGEKRNGCCVWRLNKLNVKRAE